MARQKRLNVAGAVYHIITRGINRTDIFTDPRDRSEFLGRFAKALEKTAGRCYA